MSTETKPKYEIQVLTGAHKTVQKTLNQWKHQYKLTIQSMHPCPHNKGESIVYLYRIPK